jgi:hypothetical protein
MVIHVRSVDIVRRYHIGRPSGLVAHFSHLRFAQFCFPRFCGRLSVFLSHNEGDLNWRSDLIYDLTTTDTT